MTLLWWSILLSLFLHAVCLCADWCYTKGLWNVKRSVFPPQAVSLSYNLPWWRWSQPVNGGAAGQCSTALCQCAITGMTSFLCTTYCAHAHFVTCIDAHTHTHTHTHPHTHTQKYHFPLLSSQVHCLSWIHHCVACSNYCVCMCMFARSSSLDKASRPRLREAPPHPSVGQSQGPGMRGPLMTISQYIHHISILFTLWTPTTWWLTPH